MPKCPYYKRVCIKRALRYNIKDTCFINKRTKADIFTTTKCLNCTLTLISLNYRNLIVIYNSLGEICATNQAEILTALNHCLVSSAIVTVNSDKFKLRKLYAHLLTRNSGIKINFLLLLVKYCPYNSVDDVSELNFVTRDTEKVSVIISEGP